MDPLMGSAAGLEAATAALTTADDNLANTQSTGFLALLTRTRAWDPAAVSRVTPGTAPVGGPVPEGVAVTTTINTAPSPWTPTENPLDVAVPGSGFLAVRTAAGVAYTRSGALQLSPNGMLTDAAGHPVLTTAGTPVTVPAGAVIAIASDGMVSANGTQAGRLQQVTLTGPLTDLGGSLYQGLATPTKGAVFIPGALNRGSNQALSGALDALVEAQNAYGADASSWHVDAQVGQMGDKLATLP